MAECALNSFIKESFTSDGWRLENILHKVFEPIVLNHLQRPVAYQRILI
jgi:hypothetical protein